MCIGFYDIRASAAVQYWWYLWSLLDWRTTNSHRTSTHLDHVETSWWFQYFVVFTPPYLGKWSSGVNLRPREIVVYLIAVRLVRLEKLIVKGEAQERRWRTPSGGNIGSLLVVCWPGSFGYNKKENIDPLYKFTDRSLYIINRKNTMIGIYRYFGEQLSDMLYFQNLLTPVLSTPEKAVDH